MAILRISELRSREGIGLLSFLSIYSMIQSFRPLTAYSTPYLVSEKRISNFQVTNQILPFRSYGLLAFALLAAPGSKILSSWHVIQIGNLGGLFATLLLRFGESLLPMQIVEVLNGLNITSSIIFSSYVLLLVTNKNFQILTSVIQATGMAAMVLASELGQLLVLENISYDAISTISIVMAVLQCLLAFRLPKDIKEEKKPKHSFNLFSTQKEFWNTVKETWRNKNLQLLSLWWAIFMPSIELVSLYGTTLFEGIDPTSAYNGHVLAFGTAAGFLSSISAIYLDKAVSMSGGLVYIIGSVVTSVSCFLLANYKILWASYALFIVSTAVQNLLLCLVFAQCGRLVINDEYTLLFSFNMVLSLVIGALFQALIEILGVDIFSQYEVLGIYFGCLTLVFSVLCIVRYKYTGTVVLAPFPSENIYSITPSEYEPLIIREDASPQDPSSATFSSA